MRLKTLCAVAVIVGAIWGSDSRADEPSSSGSWLGRWFNFGKPANKKNFDDAPVQPLPTTSDSQRTQAVADLHRRQEVCLKLQNIAIATNDVALQIEVERLEQQIWRHYMQMTGHLSPAPLQPADGK